MSLGAMDIFKHLPAGKKEENANCKKCGCPTCMMFAMKLSKSQAEPSLCPFIPDNLRQMLEHNSKIQQQTLTLGHLKIGGETVMYRHEKTFINPCVLAIVLDSKDADYIKKLNKILDYEIECIGEKYKIDAVYFKNPIDSDVAKLKEKNIEIITDEFLSGLCEVKYTNYSDTVNELIKIRHEAIINRNENFSKPVYMQLCTKDILSACAIASTLVCKYVNLLIFDELNEALVSSLITLRLNIYTDPQKPLQVESKVYEFNNPDENALIFLTTNFALSYFAVANELSSLKCGSYLVITPSEGMSVLTAWSAQKITAEIASKVVSANDVLNKVKNKQIIIPGLLSDLKDELQEALPEWKIIVGTTEAYKIPDFVKKLQSASLS